MKKVECPPEKILNPKTNRCVSKSGKIGKMLVKQTTPLEKNPKTPAIDKNPKQKDCPSDKILNPKTNRCVSKSGKIGKMLEKSDLPKVVQELKVIVPKVPKVPKVIVPKVIVPKVPKVPKVIVPKVVPASSTKGSDTKPDKILNPKSGKYVSITSSIGKKLLKEKQDEKMLNVSDWVTQTKPSGVSGSNPAKIFYSPENVKYYGKIIKKKNFERAENEVLAGKLYSLANVPVLQSVLAKYKDDYVFLSLWVPNLKKISSESDKQEARKDFIIDAWLANWDIVVNDNLLISDSEGIRKLAIRVDNGGSLDYRARGSKKDTTSTPFGEKVGQLTSMKKGFFKNISENEMKQQAQNLKRILNEEIKKTVFENVKNPERAQKLTNILLARKKYIIDKIL